MKKLLGFEPILSAEPDASAPVAYGDRGERVSALQRALIAAGLHDTVGSLDGIFGKRTRAAVEEFQQKSGLPVTGTAGAATLSALEKIVPAAGVLERFISYLYAQLGHIYVWGGDGEKMSPALIERMETSSRNIARALTLYERRVSEGKSPILGYDCSGLISRFLEDGGYAAHKRSSRHLYDMCSKIERDALKGGDLVFRHNGIRIYHVGVYVGGGRVIESKGRDDGVVERDINASGSSYWNRYGRLPMINGNS